MNKRQKKKFDKKLGCRSYADYRLRRIMKAVRNHYDIGSNDILYIVESKRGKYKCPLKVQLFKDCYPKSMSTGARGNDVELSFTCNSPSEMLKPYTDTLNALSDGDSIMTRFYRTWMNGVSGSENKEEIVNET